MSEVSSEKRGRGRPRLDASEAREDIKLAALSEFAKHGFRGANIDRIAAQASVAKRLVHYHFGSKENLWEQAVGDAYAAFETEAKTFVAQLGPDFNEAAFDNFSIQLVRFAASQVALIQISIDETRQGGPRADWLKARYLVPLQRLMMNRLNSTLNAQPGESALAAHLVPGIFGAIVFPFIDAEVTADVHGVDVFTDTYIRTHADFVKRILEASVGGALADQNRQN